MTSLYKYELQKASDILVRELFKIQPGEVVAITADTETDQTVVKSAARAVEAVGGKPLVILTASPLGVSKAADPMLPVASMSEALKACHAWIEFNKKWILFSTPYDEAMKANKNLRHMCLTGSTVQTMINCISRVDYPLLKVYAEKFTEKIRKAKSVRMTSKAGMDIKFDNSSDNPVLCETGYADTPGTHMMAGQIAWTPDLESINGIVVLDGSIAPGIGLIKDPVRIQIGKGKIRSIDGGKEAAEYENWLKGFDHPQMLSVAHTGIGFNIGAKMSGDILEDQRVWGSTTWGFGSISAGLLPPNGMPGPSHTDSVALNTSIYLDGELVIEDGVVVDHELSALAEKL